jgi:hypothetical protein
MTAGVPIRPQCVKLYVSYYVETQYAQAFNNSAITKLFNPNSPILFDVSQTREDDADTIKGYEFPYDPDADVITAQDATAPMTFRAYLNVLGWMMALLTGTDSVTASAPNYTHVFKYKDACAGDQLPSTNLITMFGTDTASFYKLKGACLNEMKLSVDKAGIGQITGNFQSDGTITVVNTFSPASSTIATADPVAGVMADFKWCDYGGSLVSQKSRFMGADFTVNNNLDVADGRACIAANTVYLGSLRMGNRTTTLSVKVTGHQGDEFYTAYLAKTKKDIEFSLTLSATRSIVIRAKKVTIASIKPSFSGIRDTIEVTFKTYYETADSAPWTVTIMNGDAAYLLPITPSM